MKWQEVRELYPNQFIKFEIVESHIVNNKEYVDEIAFIKTIKDGKEAMKEFFKDNKKGQLVYSTAHEELVIQRVIRI